MVNRDHGARAATRAVTTPPTGGPNLRDYAVRWTNISLRQSPHLQLPRMHLTSRVLNVAETVDADFKQRYSHPDGICSETRQLCKSLPHLLVWQFRPTPRQSNSHHG